MTADNPQVAALFKRLEPSPSDREIIRSQPHPVVHPKFSNEELAYFAMQAGFGLKDFPKVERLLQIMHIIP